MLTPHFPLQDFLGFEVHPGDGAATATLELGEQHMNPNGVAHGSVTFAMMDTAMGAAVMSVLDEAHLCATIEMQTRFHKGVSAGPLTATASVLTKGRRIIHLQAQVTDGAERLIASATASFAVIQPPPS